MCAGLLCNRAYGLEASGVPCNSTPRGCCLNLLSIGFDIQNGQLHSASYDLLASESRTAAFVAIAKEEVSQETWFLLGRTHTFENRRPVLLSWTGTMFEYLMPALWMQTYPN